MTPLFVLFFYKHELWSVTSTCMRLVHDGMSGSSGRSSSAFYRSVLLVSNWQLWMTIKSCPHFNLVTGVPKGLLLEWNVCLSENSRVKAQENCTFYIDAVGGRWMTAKTAACESGLTSSVGCAAFHLAALRPCLTFWVLPPKGPDCFFIFNSLKIHP